MSKLIDELLSDVQTPDCDCQRCVLFRTAADALAAQAKEIEALRNLLKEARTLLATFLPPTPELARIDAAIDAAKGE